MLVLLYPCEYGSSRNVDPMYQEEAKTLQQLGFNTYLIDTDTLKFPKSVSFVDSTILYRGWMLDKASYQTLENMVSHENGNLFISTDTYLLAHYLPNWYAFIGDLTAQTMIYESIEQASDALEKLAWDKYFIKDFVKSLNTSVGSVVENKVQLETLLSEMNKYRGNIEGGICIRKYENYLPETEERYFIVNKKAYSRHEDATIPDILRKVASKISHPFYSVDIIKDISGKDRVVEIGDGQVSDLKDWSLNRFTSIIRENFGSL